MNPKLKSAAIYGAILIGGFFAAYGALSMAGYRPGVEVTFGAGSAPVDGDNFAKIVAMLLPILTAVLAAWYRSASESQKQQTQDVIERANEIADAVRKALEDAGITRRPPAPAPSPPIPLTGLDGRMAQVEGELREIKKQLAVLIEKLSAAGAKET